MKPLFTCILLLISSFFINAQSVNNGNFSSAATGWGCNPETNAESVYGGSTSNGVAEIDSEAGLCQTISGFTIGSVYRFSLSYCRRTGGCAGPNPANGIITISNGALSANISSSVSSYSLQSSVFTFTATRTTLTLTIAANFSSPTTCGLIIDNVAINLYSGLPIELVSFNAHVNGKEDVLEWKTASEINNDFFSIERSQDALHWEELQTIKGSGNSREIKQYRTTVDETMSGIYYYRLKQTDYDKTLHYSDAVAVERTKKQELRVYPVPATDLVYISGLVEPDLTVSCIDAMGEEIPLNDKIYESGTGIHTSQLKPGVYTLKLVSGKEVYYRRIIIH